MIQYLADSNEIVVKSNKCKQREIDREAITLGTKNKGVLREADNFVLSEQRYFDSNKAERNKQLN